MQRKLTLLLALSLFFAGSPGLPCNLFSQPWQVAQAQQQQKLALVIGNKDYTSSPLKNTLNDARDMAAKLKKLGFSVILRENLPDEKAMKRALLDASKQIQPGGVFLFYYSGHGMQVRGTNYLIPTRTEISKEEDVEYEGLNFNRVLSEIEAGKASVNIVLLDACRNNPFGNGFKSVTKGLAIIDKSPRGTFIGYATAPGGVSSDNVSGRNGLFTGELLKHLEQPNLTLEQIFKRAAKGVQNRENQTPWFTSSVTDDYYFIPPQINNLADPECVSCPSAGKAGENLTFQFKLSYGGPEQMRVVVDWGDGSSQGMGGWLTNTGVSTLAHRYSRRGRYTIQVRAWTQGGKKSVGILRLDVDIAAQQPKPTPTPTPQTKPQANANQGVSNMVSKETLVSQSQQFFIQGLYDKAIQAAGNAILIDPGYGEAHIKRGEAFYALKKYDLAKEDLSKAIQLVPKNANLFLQRGATSQQLGEHELALVDLNRALEINANLTLEDIRKRFPIDPNEAWGLIYRGEVYYLLKKYDLAIQDFNNALEMNPNATLALARRGNVYRRQGKYDLALADFNKALQVNRYDGWTLARRGATYNTQGKYDLALDDLNQTLRLTPNDAWALKHRGVTYYNQGEYDLALADLNKSIEINPNDAWALKHRGNTYRLQGKNELALADLNKSIEIDPNDAWVFTSRGHAHRNLQAFDRAIQDMTQALQLEPSSHWALWSRGETYKMQSKYDQALADVNKALEINPNHAGVLITRAEIYSAMQKQDLAFADVNKALEINSNSAWAYNVRGKIHLDLKAYSSAIEDFDKALELNPNDADAYKNRLKAYATCPDRDCPFIIKNKWKMSFSRMDPGEFIMGSPVSEEGRDNDESQHTVTFDRGFYLQKYEVSQAEWQAVMGSNPSFFKDDSLPVENVSWEDVQTFINKLNQTGEGKYRLPTEAEWEYAARYSWEKNRPNYSMYAFSNSQDIHHYANFADKRALGFSDAVDAIANRTLDDGHQTTALWYSYPRNSYERVSPFTNMHGNVWEWVQDWYGDYPTQPETNPQGPATGQTKVCRGGSWSSTARQLRSANREHYLPSTRANNIGFRLVWEPDSQ